jgi:uncharacterized membrane protein YeaQ/YmgE (transglycosylase-associated protein family)
MMEDKLLEARIKALLMAAKTMAFVIVAITCAMIAGLFVSNEVIDNKDVFGLLSYVMTSVVGAVAGSYATLMGMKGELVPPTPEDHNDPEPEEPVSPPPAPQPEPTPVADVTELELTDMVDDDDDDDDDMEPWEKYRGDLRYDANGDGVVDENDFPDWRSAGK